MKKLRVKNLSVSYGGKRALGPVSLDIEPHSIVALIGPSGCGKSSFLRSLNRMNELLPGGSVSGEVLLDDHNVYDAKVDPVAVRRRIGMIAQKPDPFAMSIFRNVTYGLRVAGLVPKREFPSRAETALRSAALWDEVKHRLREPAFGLSGGQQQRLCIARAIAVKPEVLLMDEPTSALDPIATARIEELIKNLSREFTVVIVTHNLAQAARVSTHTAFFYLGDLIEYGETGEIFVRPKHEKTEQYLTGKFG